MRLSRVLRTSVVAGGLGTLVLVGWASAQMPKAGSGDPIADRQRLMKLNGANWRDAQDKAKAGNFEAIAVNAETIAVTGAHIPALFPQGSTSDKSSAKPEIWQKWDEFQQAATNLTTWAEQLRDASRAKDSAKVQEIMKEFGGKACGACHQPFRVPPKQ